MTKTSTSLAPLPRPISLEDLSSLNCFPSSTRLIFRGIIKSPNIFRAGTIFILQAVPEDPTPKVEIKIGFKGEWAFNQFQNKIKHDETIILKSTGGRIKDNGDHKLVLYEQQVEGYFVDQEEVAFKFSNKTQTEEGEKKKVVMKTKGVQTLESSYPPPPPRPSKSARKRSAQNIEEVQEESSVAIEEKMKKRKQQAGEKENSDWNLKVSSKLSYTPLNGLVASKGSGKNFALVIVSVEINPPRSNSADWFIKLKVSDPTLFERGGDGEEESIDEIPTIELLWYEKDPKKSPRFFPKDVLFVRNLYVENSNGKITIKRSSMKATEITSILLKSSELLDSNIVASFISKPFSSGGSLTSDTLTEVELKYAIQLAEFFKDLDFSSFENPDWSQLASSSSTTQSQVTSTQSGKTVTPFPGQTKRWCEIKDVRDGEFCDVYGEILKVYIPDDPTQAISMFITDYTSNRDLFNFDSNSLSVLKDGFPVGQKTLQIGIFGNLQYSPFSKLSEEELVGNFVNFKNLRPKLTNGGAGESGGGLLECTLVDDQKYPDKVYGKLILKRDGWKPKPVVDLLKRKRQLLEHQ